MLSRPTSPNIDGGSERAPQGRQYDDNGDQYQEEDHTVGRHVAHPLDPVEKFLHRGFWSGSRRGHVSIPSNAENYPRLLETQVSIVAACYPGIASNCSTFKDRPQVCLNYAAFSVAGDSKHGSLRQY
jgi:hypothetical protein